MVSSAAYWFIVPAAGVGRRMGATKAKQYLSLRNKTLLDQTLSRLLSITNIKGIVLALDAQDSEFDQSLYSRHEKIYRVIGGETRADSVISSLEFLKDKAADHDWILVHDAARPCITTESISLLQTTLMNDPVGGILATPVADTLKQVNDFTIVQTIDRSLLWQAQTPQMFRYKILHHALSNALANQQQITDEASAIELAGLSAKIVSGSTENIKITLPGDLALAEFILQKQEAH